MKNKLALSSLRVRNFKAIRDSKTVKLHPLNVFIGNNGSGKSSLIEALFTYQAIIKNGVEDAMNYWLGFEYVWNQAVNHPPSKQSGAIRPHFKNPMDFNLKSQSYQSNLKLTTSPNQDLFILEESLRFQDKDELKRDARGIVKRLRNREPVDTELSCRDDQSLLSLSSFSNLPYYSHLPLIKSEIEQWQFVNFEPFAMGQPQPRRRVSLQKVQLHVNGSNLSEYLLDIYEKDKSAFDDILECMQYILPYTRDLQAAQTSMHDIQSKTYLQLTEQGFKVPGWLFSTGTLRILALLAILKHPQPPSLIVIEEIENGLDPRAIHLLIEEIQSAISLGKTQIIITTHSPYLLDLLDISHLILVERNQDDEPQFIRPADQQSLMDWAREFSPGKLYTMSRLSSFYSR